MKDDILIPNHQVSLSLTIRQWADIVKALEESTRDTNDIQGIIHDRLSRHLYGTVFREQELEEEESLTAKFNVDDQVRFVLGGKCLTGEITEVHKAKDRLFYKIRIDGSGKTRLIEFGDEEECEMAFLEEDNTIKVHEIGTQVTFDLDGKTVKGEIIYVDDDKEKYQVRPNNKKLKDQTIVFEDASLKAV